MNATTRLAVSSHLKTMTLASVLLAVCALASGAASADTTSPTAKVTESGTVSLADLDVLTPKGVHAAELRIHEMARQLCLQIVNMDDLDAASCVARAVAAAEQKLNAVIQARLAERSAHTVASTSKK